MPPPFELPHLKGRFLLVPATTYTTIISQIRALLNKQANTRQFNIADLSLEQARPIFLQNPPIATNTQVYVVWPAVRVAIKMDYDLFVQHYDDLWFPSSDDVWITLEPFDWLIEISHEEIITFLTLTKH